MKRICSVFLDEVRKTKLIALVFCMMASCMSCADRVGSWNAIQMSHQIDQVVVGASEESRIGVNRHESPKKFDEFHSTAFADFNVNHMLSVGIQDDLVYIRNRSDARYRRDNRPGLNIALSYSTSQWSFMNRSRFVMRDLEDAQPYLRYRNLSKIVAPSLGNFCREHSIRPYFAYEWYFDEGSRDVKFKKNDKFSQFWIDAGIQAKLTASCSISMFYRLVELKSNDAWNPGHIIGVFLNFSI